MVRTINTIEKMLISFLRVGICGGDLDKTTVENINEENLVKLYNFAHKHDLAHIVADVLFKKKLIPDNEIKDIYRTNLMMSLVRYQNLSIELEKVCTILEENQIAHIPLKGSVIRRYYPEPWLRTSCDIDILINKDDLDKAILLLSQNLQYVANERSTHDILLFSPEGVRVELHFDLVEEGRANNAIQILSSVWDNVSLHNKKYCYEMTDEFFYFYHIAHMAKHFENGGCGIRSFIDLWILDNIDGADIYKRDKLLSKGNLLDFANNSRNLSRVWFGKNDVNELSLQMQEFVVNGGAYGNVYYRVALQQVKKGGRIGYIISRIFVPYERLKRYYPVLEKHSWLMPFMQVKRWFMLLRPNVAKMAKNEIDINKNIDKFKVEEMNKFLKKVGL